ncbi:hypothetical protein [Catelliglobosispora koreensis]|uniref:hypothetical protein n=1 Tax=Catelliglobosispora koreensis TaxID=129052 RepID=UPI00035CDA28|nr:hypothetical protein [Catelliglobosispora koreensis]
MRRFMLPLFAGLTLATALTACNSSDTPTAPQSSAPAASSQAAPKGDDKAACATFKAARLAAVNDVLMAAMTVTDASSTTTEITEAATDLKTAFTKLKDEMAKASSQAETAKLKESLKAYSDGAAKAVANVQAAGTDRSKLEAATEIPEMDAAEKTAMAMCA